MEPGSSRIRYYIDQPKSWLRLSRCLIITGWCFEADGGLIRALRLRTAGLSFSGLIGLPRPDVRAAFPNAGSDNTGFHIHALLPTGRNQVQIEAQVDDGSWHPIFDELLSVERRWRPLWLPGSSWTELMFFQMPGHLKHAPRPIQPEHLPLPPQARRRRPRLSVVTPSYQQQQYLSDTIRSVLNQSNVDCEYVVQDGGSTDGSIEVIRRFVQSSAAESGARLVSWATERDSGQADAIVRAFAKTQGTPEDVMAWINSDDFYMPGALGYVADYFAEHPDVDLVYGHRVLVDENSQEIGRWFLPPHDPEVLQLNDWVPQETMFWRRRIWDKVGGIDPSFRFAMDWDLLLRFQAAGAKIMRVPYFLACFRIHSAQKTSAQMISVGQKEIDSLRLRTFGRMIPPPEIENHPRLLKYLRKSAWIEFLWRRFRLRHR